jgi:DNA-directed RNA polymerase specialized sigma24 family protein
VTAPRSQAALPGLAEPLGQAHVALAVSGDRVAMRALLRELTPMVQVRVGRALYRYRGSARRREVRQEADDLVQEVLVELFRHDAKVLRSWDPSRGLSLLGFVRLVTDRTASAILGGARTPWRDDPIDPQDFSGHATAESTVETRVMSAQLAARVYEALVVELTPLAFRVFELMFVEEADVPTISATLNMTPEAVYAWRPRLMKTIRQLADELDSRQPAAGVASSLSEGNPR